MDFITATTSNWFLIGPISVVLGWVMNGIYEVLDLIGIANIGLSIILFTIIIKALMLPLSIKQQKFSKLNSVMSPEIQAIQKKYKNKKDNESMLKQQEEMKEVYEKYGTSMTGGCVQLLLQMPILFALYQVIYHIPGHIAKVKELYVPIQNALMNIQDYATNQDLITLAQSNAVSANDLTNGNRLIDMFYNFDPSEWEKLLNIFNNDALTNAYLSIQDQINHINLFLTLDLSKSPAQQIWPGILIPILAGLTQWLSSKIAQNASPTSSKNNDAPGAGMMKSMTTIMPLMSMVFCFTFASGIGVYWIISAVVQIVIQLFVNRYMEKVDINHMVEKNMEKVNRKRAKKGLPPKKLSNKPVISVKNLEEEEKLEKEENVKKAEMAKKSSEYYDQTAKKKKGSLAAKAAMVQQYDEKMKNEKGKNTGNK